MDNGAGGTVDNVFDQSGRLTIANPGADKEQTYTYDAVGNLTSVSSPNVNWYNRVFRYDSLNRLEHAEGPFGTLNYTYDGAGNRLTKVLNGQTETYAYTPGTNRLQETTGPIDYTYDANGNITGIGDKVFTYNQNNRLISVEENSNILGEYVYNGLGQRMVKTANGVTTVFHYDFDGHIIGESDENGNFVYEYLYKGNTRLVLVDVASGEKFSFLNDRLGTPLMLTDSTNTVVWEGIYKPFGEAEVNANSSVVNNFRFAGQYYDAETGLHYNYNRYYDPDTGRYLTPDPIGLAGGMNLFLYVFNNSVNMIDLYGLISEADPFNPAPNIPTLNLTKGQKMAIIKIVGGGSAIVGGAFLGQPEVIAGGIVIFADGLTLSIAELLGGDTSEIPSDYEIVKQIFKGITKSWTIFRENKEIWPIEKVTPCE